MSALVAEGANAKSPAAFWAVAATVPDMASCCFVGLGIVATDCGLGDGNVATGPRQGIALSYTGSIPSVLYSEGTKGRSPKYYRAGFNSH